MPHTRAPVLVPLLAALGCALAAGCSPADDTVQRDVRNDVDGRTDGVIEVDDGGGDAPFSCLPGQWDCWGAVRYRCGDDGASRVDETTCELACDPVLGCVMCRPGTRRCEGNVSMVCSPEGDAWFTGRDCTEWGSECSATGACNDACGEAEATRSYVGCEYWPVPLTNTAELDSTAFDFRVVVGNPNGTAANVRVTRGSTEVSTTVVPAGGLAEIALPWIAGQSFGIPMSSWGSIAVRDGAYRLRSDVPVTVSQFNPFEYSATGADGVPVFSYTNDATLLLPSHVLTGDYVGLTYVPFSVGSGTTGPFPMPPDFMSYAGYITIVGIAPESTEVTVYNTGIAAGEASGRFPESPMYGAINFTVERGEVVHVASGVPPECRSDRPGYNRTEDCTMGICDYLDACRETDYDLTGTRIEASGPIEAFGGHVCAYVPYTNEACDHLEVQLPPIQTWGREYVSRPMTDGGGPGENLVRVVAAFDGTYVTVEPPQGGVGEAWLDANQWVEFMAAEPFRVGADHAIQVGQFLVGQYYPEPDAARGDPAMTVLVPSEQFRSDYIFVAPSSYNPGTNGQNFLLVIRSPGMEVRMDGTPVSADWQAAAGREVGIVLVDGGTHTITGTAPFGMIAYGLGSFTSYAYPAGLNLDPITILI